MEQNLGKVSVTPKGVWDSSIDYAANDIVTYNHNAYIARIASKNITPGVASGWDNYWMLFVNQTEIALGEAFPVGSIYINIDNTNPSSIFGGTWVRFGAGKMLVGLDENDTDFNEPQETGGEKVHTLTVNEMPSHAHSYGYDTTHGSRDGLYGGTSGYLIKSGYVGTVGGGQPHNNMPPYIVVCFWLRTA